MKLNCTFSKIKFAALAGLTVISLQAPLVHADDGANNMAGSQNQGDTIAAEPQPSVCCTPMACITPCP
ncbi:hypothetical protein F4W70_30030 [Pseudomonas cannabina]|nr:hypothetical protein F4W70_30030 [Pseudomonas cannabina]